MYLRTTSGTGGTGGDSGGRRSDQLFLRKAQIVRHSFHELVREDCVERVHQPHEERLDRVEAAETSERDERPADDGGRLPVPPPPPRHAEAHPPYHTTQQDVHNDVTARPAHV